MLRITRKMSSISSENTFLKTVDNLKIKELLKENDFYF